MIDMDFSRHQKFIVGNYAPPALEIIRGEGSILWDKNGKDYLDFASGIAVTNLGHGHPHWVKCVQQQASDSFTVLIYSLFLNKFHLPKDWWEIGDGKFFSVIVVQKQMKH